MKSITEIKYRLARPDFGEEELNAVRRVLISGNLVQGKEVAAFEDAVGQLTGEKHCIAVSSGTAAIHICYLALNLKAGDLVFIPSFAWPSAANLALLMGARPILVDVLPGTYNMDPENLRNRIHWFIEQRLGTPRIVVPVHQFGLPCEIEAVIDVAREFNLDVIEDAACALGASVHSKSVGHFGDAGVFSFHPRKSVTTGEGGMIVTNSDELASRCRALRNHGQAKGSKFDFPGLNYRMTEMQAAIGSVQLTRLAGLLDRRKQIALRYLQQLTDYPGICLPDAPREHTWQTFMVVVDGLDRDTLITCLRERFGMEVSIGSVDTHSLEQFRSQSGWVSLPVSGQLNKCGLALPLHSQMTDEDVDFCAGSLIEAVQACRFAQVGH